MRAQNKDEEEALSTWEFEQLRFQPNVRKRLRVELEAIHRQGSLVEAFEKHNDLLAHLLAYAWRDTNSLMRTCKRFYAAIQTRDYWRALAIRAFASRVPKPVLEQMDWFHGLSADEPPYSFLWGRILSSSSPGWGVISDMRQPDRTLFLTHFRTDEVVGLFRRVIRLRWHGSKDKGYWYSIASFTVCSEDPDEADVFQPSRWVPVYVTYFGHPRLRRRMFVAPEDQLLNIVSRERDDDPYPVVINCYNELWDPVTGRTWHGECPLAVRDRDDDDGGYGAWMPNTKSHWGTWQEPPKKPLDV